MSMDNNRFTLSRCDVIKIGEGRGFCFHPNLALSDMFFLFVSIAKTC